MILSGKVDAPGNHDHDDFETLIAVVHMIMKTHWSDYFGDYIIIQTVIIVCDDIERVESDEF